MAAAARFERRRQPTGFIFNVARCGPTLLANMLTVQFPWGSLLREVRPATAEEIVGSHSTWAKRLGAGSRRPAWLVRFERIEAAGAGAMADLEAAT